ncbi:MAG: sulfotransferase domain-containing protein, partial [Actinomycetota bacterium]|nr:sulfotransferase domain-containing protein [Actinomycetota bacterium]
MTATVFLHVGPYKSGTTFLQLVLDKNRQALAGRGYCLPLGESVQQAIAAVDVLGKKLHGEGRVHGRWDRLAAEVREWDGPVAVVSAESLSRATKRQVDRIVSSLEPAEVHVVYTARDLAKVVPSMWQTHMRNKGAMPWRDYLAAVRGDDDTTPLGRRFWDQQDPREVLSRWAGRVPPERIHVVTVPRSGTDPSLLWQRFCSVLGLDPSPYSLKVRRANESLGLVEAELLRRLNARVVGDIRGRTYSRWVKNFIARRVLEQRPDQRRLVLPAEEHAWLRPRMEEICAYLREQGYDLVGDLDDLLPDPAAATQAASPDTVEAEEVLEAAVDVLAGMVHKLDRS